MVRERLTNLLTAKIAARGFLGTVYLISFACPSSGARCDAKLLERPSWFAPEFRENYYLRHVLNDWNVLNDLERAPFYRGQVSVVTKTALRESVVAAIHRSFSSRGVPAFLQPIWRSHNGPLRSPALGHILVR